MAIADVILLQISKRGFEVQVEETAAEMCAVGAREPVTGRQWRGTGPTLIEAAEALEREMGLCGEEADVSPLPIDAGAGGREGAAEGAITGILVLTMVAAIFLVDLMTPGVNLGILYLVPMCAAYRKRMDSRWYVPLALLSILLIFAEHLEMEGLSGRGIRMEPAGLLNRCFAVLAITGSALVIRLMLARHVGEGAEQGGHDFWERFGESRRGVGWFVGAYVAAIFVVDLTTPVAANVPIFYLVPVTLVATMFRRSWLWRFLGLLPALMVLGYLASSRDGMMAADAVLVVLNRLVIVGALVILGVVWHAGGANGPRVVEAAMGGYARAGEGRIPGFAGRSRVVKMSEEESGEQILRILGTREEVVLKSVLVREWVDRGFALGDLNRGMASLLKWGDVEELQCGRQAGFRRARGMEG